MKHYQFHPFSELFPLMAPADTKVLAESIRTRGLQRPITLYEGKILDGRHRYEACLIANVEPRFDLYRGKDALGFVLAANLERRHLDTSQRAMIAAKLENMPHGRPEIKDANLHLKRQEMAEALSVSPRSVATASRILDEDPALAKQVATGKISLHSAGEKLAAKEMKGEPVVDETGWEIPKERHQLWSRRGEVREMLSQITSIENRLLQFQKDKDELFNVINFSSAVSKLQFAHMEIKNAQLYAVCTSCQGRNYAKCKLCKGRGILSKFVWDNAVPEEIKTIRKNGSLK